MKRLGYKRYVAQGGDWGSVVADKMACQARAGLLGIHVNMPATVPADVAKAINDGDPAPAGLTDVEKAAFDSLSTFFSKNGAYGVMMTTRPQTRSIRVVTSRRGKSRNCSASRSALRSDRCAVAERIAAEPGVAVAKRTSQPTIEPWRFNNVGTNQP
jgi:hypothetical protein